MSDEQLFEELIDLNDAMRKMMRFGEVETDMATVSSEPYRLIALAFDWLDPDEAETPDGFVHLKILFNGDTIFKVGVPNDRKEPIERSMSIATTTYLETASSSQVRQLKIALQHFVEPQ